MVKLEIMTVGTPEAVKFRVIEVNFLLGHLCWSCG
jgi:hypothetical protein